VLAAHSNEVSGFARHAIVFLEYRYGSGCKEVGRNERVAYIDDETVSVARLDPKTKGIIFELRLCTRIDGASSTYEAPASQQAKSFLP